MSGYDMLGGKLTRIKAENEKVIEAAKDFAITPLGVPMITGPGVITISIVLMNDAGDFSHKSMLVALIFLVMGLPISFFSLQERSFHLLVKAAAKF